MKVLWFDTETTGLDPEKNDIVQIAGLIEIDGKVEKEFNLTCSPFNPDNISQEALDVTNRTKDDLMSQQAPQKLYAQLTSMFSKRVNKFDKLDKFVPAGQNVIFDMNFLNQFFVKNNDKYYGSYFKWSPIDLRGLVALYEYKKGETVFENHKLETVCKVLDIPLTNAHDALADIHATRNAFIELNKRYMELPCQ